ncbi:unnamed protein product, partial [Prorocentrum cordatum]
RQGRRCAAAPRARPPRARAPMRPASGGSWPLAAPAAASGSSARLSIRASCGAVEATRLLGPTSPRRVAVGPPLGDAWAQWRPSWPHRAALDAAGPQPQAEEDFVSACSRARRRCWGNLRSSWLARNAFAEWRAWARRGDPGRRCSGLAAMCELDVLGQLQRSLARRDAAAAEQALVATADARARALALEWLLLRLAMAAFHRAVTQGRRSRGLTAFAVRAAHHVAVAAGRGDAPPSGREDSRAAPHADLIAAFAAWQAHAARCLAALGRLSRRTLVPATRRTLVLSRVFGGWRYGYMLARARAARRRSAAREQRVRERVLVHRALAAWRGARAARATDRLALAAMFNAWRMDRSAARAEEELSERWRAHSLEVAGRVAARCAALLQRALLGRVVASWRWARKAARRADASRGAGAAGRGRLTLARAMAAWAGSCRRAGFLTRAESVAVSRERRCVAVAALAAWRQFHQASRGASTVDAVRQELAVEVLQVQRCRILAAWRRACREGLAGWRLACVTIASDQRLCLLPALGAWRQACDCSRTQSLAEESALHAGRELRARGERVARFLEGSSLMCLIARCMSRWMRAHRIMRLATAQAARHRRLLRAAALAAWRRGALEGRERRKFQDLSEREQQFKLRLRTLVAWWQALEVSRSCEALSTMDDAMSELSALQVEVAGHLRGQRRSALLVALIRWRLVVVAAGSHRARLAEFRCLLLQEASAEHRRRCAMLSLLLHAHVRWRLAALAGQTERRCGLGERRCRAHLASLLAGRDWRLLAARAMLGWLHSCILRGFTLHAAETRGRCEARLLAARAVLRWADAVRAAARQRPPEPPRAPAHARQCGRHPEGLGRHRVLLARVLPAWRAVHAAAARPQCAAAPAPAP